MKQRRPTTIITITTVHNQTKQDRVTVHVEIRYWLCFHHFPAHLIFFCVFHQTFDAQQAECSICSMALCAAWLWHLHRQPWVLQRGRLLSVGCSYPSGDSLHMESLSVSGDTKVGIQRVTYSEEDYIRMVGRRLEVVFSGTRLESAMIEC